MRSFTPEISWHNREPVFSVDVQAHVQTDAFDPSISFYRIASAGGDNCVIIWRAQVKHAVTTDERSDSTIESECRTKTVANNKDSIDLEVVATLNLHIKTVNCAKFAPQSNMLASGGDDSYVYIWKLEEESNSDEMNASQEEKDKHNPFNEFDDQFLICKERWKRMVTLRRHIEDVVDLAWSPDERFLVTGSVDNMALVWDVKKAEVLYTLNKHDGYVQGVAWDPLNNFVATLCTDRSLRFFSTQSKKLISKLRQIPLKSTSTPVEQEDKDKEKEKEKPKSSLVFYDDTLATISRRMSFSPNGELLMVPSGIMELDDDEKDSEKDKFLNVVHIFSRDNLKRMKCYVPTGTYSTSVRFCPCLYKLKEKQENPFPFPYRIVYAIASKHSVLVYDTQQPYPIAKISDIHYTKLSDISWSSDGRILIVSSTDGYCTFILFAQNELGDPYDGAPYEFQSPVKEITSKKRERKEKEDQLEVTPIVEKVPEAAKITNFFKKLPAGTPATVHPIAVRKASSNTPTSISSSDVSANDSCVKVNQLQVRRQNAAVMDPSKQPRRIMFTTLLSKPVSSDNSVKPAAEVLKETHNTKQESDVKDVQKTVVELDDIAVMKPEVIDLRSTEEDAEMVDTANADAFVKENQADLNMTPQRNKRKTEGGSTPDDLKQSAKKRVSLIKIE